jgi:hypothetical protein
MVPFQLVVSKVPELIDPAIVLSMFTLSFIFVVVCGLLGVEANLLKFVYMYCH